MATPALRKVLITGAGTGFGHEAAMRLAEKGFDVIAGVEIYAQVQTMKTSPWQRKVTDGLGTRHQAITHSYEMQPETPVAT